MSELEIQQKLDEHWGVMKREKGRLLSARGWEITRGGRDWDHEFFSLIYELIPLSRTQLEKKLYSEKDRDLVIQALLDNFGIDAFVRFGDPDLWRTAIQGRLEETDSAWAGTGTFRAA